LYVKTLHWRKTKLEWAERRSARIIKGEKVEGKRGKLKEIWKNKKD
jgi:hypothetical protein